MRDPRDRFQNIQTVGAAAGVMIVSPELDGTLPGSPLVGVDSEANIGELSHQIESEVKQVFVQTDSNGVVLKADTLGSLEALTDILKAKGFPIRIADIGPVTRRDVVEADVVRSKDKYLGVVLAFNVRILQDAAEEAQMRRVQLFSERVIYSLIDTYGEWVLTEKEKELRAGLSILAMPSKFKVIKGTVFRRSNPAIVGAEILEGRLKQKVAVMNERGRVVGYVQQIQDKGKPIGEARPGQQVAISMAEPIVGRHINEGETLYSLPSDSDTKLLRGRYLSSLSEREKSLLEEVIEVRRKESALYAF
jgi:translation initiation factor 5B